MTETAHEPRRRRVYGERPGWGEGFDYDEGRHLVAYKHATLLATGKRVLDAGCGEGFGTQQLAAVALEVVGVDHSAEAVESARYNWQRENLSFRIENLSVPTAGGDLFDLIVSFQVLEHIADEVAFLESLRRRLAPGGVLMLTTPNVLQSFSENPFHLREYRADELERLLRSVFSAVELMGVHGNEKVRVFDERRKAAVERILRLDPLGLRRLLPRPLLNFAFARLGQLVRLQARTSGEANRIATDDFCISSDSIDDAIDLVAFCRA